MALLPPSAGALRQSVQFQRRAAQANVAGVVKSDWADLGLPCAASLLATTGGEQIVGQRVEGRAVYDLWVRSWSFTRGITLADRVIDARDPTHAFDIRFISDPDGKRAWLFMQVVSAS